MGGIEGNKWKEKKRIPGIPSRHPRREDDTASVPSRDGGGLGISYQETSQTLAVDAGQPWASSSFTACWTRALRTAYPHRSPFWITNIVLFYLEPFPEVSSLWPINSFDDS